MDELKMNILMNIFIGIAVIVGFIVFLSKYTNIFEEGGAAYEFVRKKKQESARKKKTQKKPRPTTPKQDNNNDE